MFVGPMPTSGITNATPPTVNWSSGWTNWMKLRRNDSPMRFEPTKNTNWLHSSDASVSTTPTKRIGKNFMRPTVRIARIDAWIIARHPELDALPSNRKKAAIDQQKPTYADAPGLRILIEAAEQAQAELEAEYPRLFITDEEINARKKAASDAVRNDPDYKRLSKDRADAYRAQQDYLLNNDAELKRLTERLSDRSAQ